ncbi:MAG: ankyrin repeat domain-containing protein [Spirochaetes bacterium]|nr:ankyrin repeat domain-containing protein [Spirochaetota bacterium]
MKIAKVFIVVLFFIISVSSCATLSYSPLMKAVNKNDVTTVNALLSQGADINENKNTYKYTPLMLAVYNGNYKMTKVLIDKGADINENNNNNAYSALMWACCYGHLDIVKLLLDSGAEINPYCEEDKPYNTALYVAIYNNDIYGRNNNTIIQLLLKRGAKIYPQHLQAADGNGGLEYSTMQMLREPYLRNSAAPEDKEQTPVIVEKMNKGQLVGLIKSVDASGNEIIVSSVVIGRLVNIGDTLYSVCDGTKINMEVTFPMQTIARCRIIDKKSISKLKVGDTVYK